MATKIEGIPEALLSADLQAGAVSILIDEALYPLEAVYGAAYVFIDRCYVFMDRPSEGNVRITLSSKTSSADEQALKELMGEFANELLSCAWRHAILKENKTYIESVTMQAIAGAMGPPSLDDLASFDFTEEPFEDPLGIAMSWEEKYKKKDAPSDAGEGEGSSGSEDKAESA